MNLEVGKTQGTLTLVEIKRLGKHILYIIRCSSCGRGYRPRGRTNALARLSKGCSNCGQSEVYKFIIPIVPKDEAYSLGYYLSKRGAGSYVKDYNSWVRDTCGEKEVKKDEALAFNRAFFGNFEITDYFLDDFGNGSYRMVCRTCGQARNVRRTALINMTLKPFCKSCGSCPSEPIYLVIGDTLAKAGSLRSQFQLPEYFRLGEGEAEKMPPSPPVQRPPQSKTVPVAPEPPFIFPLPPLSSSGEDFDKFLQVVPADSACSFDNYLRRIGVDKEKEMLFTRDQRGQYTVAYNSWVRSTCGVKNPKDDPYFYWRHIHARGYTIYRRLRVFQEQEAAGTADPAELTKLMADAKVFRDAEAALKETFPLTVDYTYDFSSQYE